MKGKARLMVGILVAVGIALAGCAIPRTFDRAGMDVPAKQALFAKDYAECEEVAYRALATMCGYPEDKMVSIPKMPAFSFGIAYIDQERAKCLEERGWKEE